MSLIRLSTLDVACTNIAYLGCFKLMSFKVASSNSSPSTTFVSFILQQAINRRATYWTPHIHILCNRPRSFQLSNVSSTLTHPFLLFSSYDQCFMSFLQCKVLHLHQNRISITTHYIRQILLYSNCDNMFLQYFFPCSFFLR